MSERASNVFYHISPQIWEKKKKARHTPKNLWGLLCIMDEAEAAAMGLVICYNYSSIFNIIINFFFQKSLDGPRKILEEV